MMKHAQCNEGKLELSQLDATACFLCGKLLVEEHLDTTILEEKEVHIPCLPKFEGGRIQSSES
jgi:hypothetical protein